MLKKSFYLLSQMILMVCISGPTMALSIGASFSAGNGESKTYSKAPFYFPGSSRLYEDNGYISTIGGGLIIDDEKPNGNYIHRYSVNLDKYSILKGFRQDLNRISFVNTFCFVLSKNDYYKFWLGPQIGVRYIFGSTKYNLYDNNRTSLIAYSFVGNLEPIISYMHKRAKYNMAGIDLGLVAGINIDIKKYMTFSTSGGLRYGAAAGGMSFRRGGLFENNRLILSHGFERFVELSILYQFDTIQSKKQTG